MHKGGINKCYPPRITTEPIKVQCSCGMLWLSETLGGYDTICDHDGKICGAVNYQDEQFQIIQPEECKKHKRDTMKELKGALQQVKMEIG